MLAKPKKGCIRASSMTWLDFFIHKVFIWGDGRTEGAMSTRQYAAGSIYQPLNQRQPFSSVIWLVQSNRTQLGPFVIETWTNDLRTKLLKLPTRKLLAQLFVLFESNIINFFQVTIITWWRCTSMATPRGLKSSGTIKNRGSFLSQFWRHWFCFCTMDWW